MSRWKPALVVLTLALAASAARAQAPGQMPTTPYSQPVVSPYLNLLNRGNPAINYYGIVRPQIQQGQQLQTLQYGLTHAVDEINTDQGTTTTTPGTATPTGHVAGFMTYQRFFNTVNAVNPRR
ncbi:MAG TPA: hypothetical protein VMS17_20340 [Gemmataceae bacterium]|nr:hypothetical protein [Gemmataceae bacterium]